MGAMDQTLIGHARQVFDLLYSLQPTKSMHLLLSNIFCKVHLSRKPSQTGIFKYSPLLNSIFNPFQLNTKSTQGKHAFYFEIFIILKEREEKDNA